MTLALLLALYSNATIAPGRIAWECPSGAYEAWGYWPRASTLGGTLILPGGRAVECGPLPCFCDPKGS